MHRAAVHRPGLAPKPNRRDKRSHDAPAVSGSLWGWSWPAALAAAIRPGPPDAPCATAAEIDGLRLNQLQVVGSHNSYRRRTYRAALHLRPEPAASLPPESRSGRPGLRPPAAPPAAGRPTGCAASSSTCSTIPKGGRFYNRQGLRFVKRAGRIEHPRAAGAGAEGAAHPRLRLRDAPLHVPLRAADDRRLERRAPESRAARDPHRDEGRDDRRRAPRPSG